MLYSLMDYIVKRRGIGNEKRRSREKIEYPNKFNVGTRLTNVPDIRSCVNIHRVRHEGEGD